MNQRPVYIDLRKIKLPMSAFSSITHRLSGMYIFFISLPLFSVLLYLSTKNKTAYENLYDSLNTFSLFSLALKFKASKSDFLINTSPLTSSRDGKECSDSFSVNRFKFCALPSEIWAHINLCQFLQKQGLSPWLDHK